MRTRNHGALSQWLLGNEMTLLRNEGGDTTLHLAIMLQDKVAVRTLLAALTPWINEQGAEQLTAALKTVALHMSEEALPFLLAVEKAALQPLVPRVP